MDLFKSKGAGYWPKVSEIPLEYTYQNIYVGVLRWVCDALTGRSWNQVFTGEKNKR